MHKLVILVGPAGSGKSTLAHQLNTMEDFVRINQDAQGREHLALFDEVILGGHNVIVDRMNFTKQQRSRYLDLAKSHGYTTKIIVLHQPYAVCLERCINRKGHETIKEEAAARSALNMFFSKYERVEDGEADVVNRVWPDGEKPLAVWVDMDNTLSDATHREHYLQGEKKNWKGFFSEMSKDPVNEWCRQLVNGMAYNSKVLICSARPDDYRKQTEDWLYKNSINYHELIMRSRGDHRKDSITKEVMYEFEVKTRYNLLFSVDDRKQVIDQIRKHGIVVLDCAGEKGHF